LRFWKVGKIKDTYEQGIFQLLKNDLKKLLSVQVIMKLVDILCNILKKQWLKNALGLALLSKKSRV